jgi:thiol-disulfide isomerase/thioredoxin
MKSKPRQKKSVKRNIIEWGIIIAVVALLYFTGLYSEVIGRVQQAVLLTGIMQPDTNIPVNQQQTADYNLGLISFDNTEMNLDDLKGKVIFLNFWASWCPPCRAEMPTIQSLYNKMQNRKDIVFVMVSLDNDTSKAKNFIKERGFNFPVYFLNGYFPKIYDSGTIPSTYVISKEGKIVAKEVGMADYDTDKFLSFLNHLTIN